MEYYDHFELVSQASHFESILRKEYQKKNSFKGLYYRDFNIEVLIVDFKNHTNEEKYSNINVVKVVAMRPYICRGLVNL